MEAVNTVVSNQAYVSSATEGHTAPANAPDGAGYRIDMFNVYFGSLPASAQRQLHENQGSRLVPRLALATRCMLPPMYATMNGGRVHMPETAENHISDEERDQL